MSKRKFNVQCEMEERWVPEFIGLLKMMQQLGSLGGSRTLSFYSDGDGDFHPTFKWDKDMPTPAQPSPLGNDSFMFDAG